MIAAANTLPFMSDRRLVILRNADKMNAAGLGAIAEYAADPNPSTTLVLVAEKIARNLKVYKAIDALGGVSEYKAPTSREYPKTVVEMFAAKGKDVGLDAAEVLVRAVGNDLRRLSIEIDKVVAFTGERDRLSRADIEEVMSTTAPTSIFDYLDALGSRDCRGALRLLSELLGGGESIFMVHSMSLRHVRDLLRIRSLMDRPDASRSAEKLGEAIGLPPQRRWTAKNLVRQAERFTASELIDAVRDAAEAEAHMKTSRESRLVFERWIVSVCG